MKATYACCSLKYLIKSFNAGKSIKHKTNGISSNDGSWDETFHFSHHSSKDPSEFLLRRKTDIVSHFRFASCMQLRDGKKKEGIAYMGNLFDTYKNCDSRFHIEIYN